jgi:probable rRNA maturation factor
MKVLRLRNLQRSHPPYSAWLRRAAITLVEEHLKWDDYDLGIYLVTPGRIRKLNEQYLRHEGDTDVISFPYSTNAADIRAGEIFICVEVALRHARRYRVSMPVELLRYVVHGLLHLEGYDDIHPAERRRMKHIENRLLRALLRRHPAPVKLKNSSNP